MSGAATTSNLQLWWGTSPAGIALMQIKTATSEEPKCREEISQGGIIGYQSLPILEAKLAEVTENQALDKHAKVG